MAKIIGVCFVLILTSFYFFPFEPIFLPGGNVKMVLAGCSLPYIAIRLAQKGSAFVSRDIVTIALFTLPIAFFSWISNVYNETYDYSFNYYFVSVFVWMGAAFVVVSAMRALHRKLNVQLVANYLIAVCCLQCVLSQLMEYNPALKVMVDGLMGGDNAFMGNAGDRIHGLGCALDVAGGRFAAVLVMIAFFLSRSVNKKEIYFYIFSFVIIAVLGNMIGRTTTIGVLLSLFYWVRDSLRMGAERTYWKYLLGTFCVTIPLLIFLYLTNDVFYNNLRFGFEGFFSLAEQGKWDTNSTNIWSQHMIVFPDNIKTWMIGDGYAMNPFQDPYYTGRSFHGFYMGTDIGYLRFIFFFGIVGLLCMLALFVHFWKICCTRFPKLKELITLLLLLNLMIWLKVTSDLLPVFAILLCISQAAQEESETGLIDA